jgi:hypothetical protein
MYIYSDIFVRKETAIVGVELNKDDIWMMFILYVDG